MAMTVSGTGSGRAEGRYEVSPVVGEVSKVDGGGGNQRTSSEAASGELVTSRRIEAEGLAVGADELVLCGVETELSGEGLQHVRQREQRSEWGGRTMAVTMSGEARKFMVRRLPSLRALKLRLNEVRMAERGSSVNGHAQASEKLTVLLILALLAIPLTNARSASVRQHDTANSLEVGRDAISLDGRVDELRSATAQNQHRRPNKNQLEERTQE